MLLILKCRLSVHSFWYIIGQGVQGETHTIGCALLWKVFDINYRDSWGFLECSKDSKNDLWFVLGQKTKILEASKASASPVQRPKNWRPQKNLKRKFYYIICGCWIQIRKNFFDISYRKKVLLVNEVIYLEAADIWPQLLTKLFSF